MPRVNVKKAESAFTLTELLVAIAIIGVITLIALPTVSILKNNISFMHHIHGSRIHFNYL